MPKPTGTIHPQERLRQMLLVVRCHIRSKVIRANIKRQKIIKQHYFTIYQPLTGKSAFKQHFCSFENNNVQSLEFYYNHLHTSYSHKKCPAMESRSVWMYLSTFTIHCRHLMHFLHNFEWIDLSQACEYYTFPFASRFYAFFLHTMV